MNTLTSRDEVVAPAPKTVPVLCIDGCLVNGQPFTFSVRADLGDTWTEGADTWTYVSGTTGATVRIRAAQIAAVTVQTVQRTLKPEAVPTPSAA